MNLSLNPQYKFEFRKGKKDYETFINNIETLYKQVLENITQLLKTNKEYKEEGYNIFYKKWKIYSKKYNNNSTLELIKDEIMNSTFLLLPEEYEKSKEEEYPEEISRKNMNFKNKYFENCLLLFMLLHDIREILLNDPNYFKGENSFNLIKNNFPLIIKKDDISDFNINEEYNLEQFNSTKIYRKSASFKLKDSEKFEEGELIIFNKHIYFGTVSEDKIIKIQLKFKLKSLGLYKNKDDGNNIINILVQSSVEDDDYIEKKDELFDGIEDKNKYIIVSFNDETIKEETSKKINEKILYINNEERIAFDTYFNEINNNIKDKKEDEEDF